MCKTEKSQNMGSCYAWWDPDRTVKKKKSHLTTINKRSDECIVLFLSPVLLSETGEL